MMLMFLILLLLLACPAVSGFTANLPSKTQLSFATRRRISPMQLSENNKEDRSQGLRKAFESVGELNDDNIAVGSTVVTGNNIPNLGIWQFQSYQVTSIYDQTVSDGGVVEKIPRESLDDNVIGTRYVTLYSSKHHKDGESVVVSPDEVELSSMREEVVDSVLMALPLFGFWTALAFSFANQYSERTGGTFVDAFFGR